MDRDDELERVLQQVRSDTARDALRAWARRKRVALAPTIWSASGFTSAQVFGVTAHDDNTYGLIIKVDPAPHRGAVESDAHDTAVRKAGAFGERHLAKPTYPPERLRDEGCISFQSVAGGGFGELLSFQAMLGEHSRPDNTCQSIIHALLTEWNVRTDRSEPVSAGALVRELLGHRLRPGGTLVKWAGAHPGLLHEPRTWLSHDDRPLVNPFALAENDGAGDGLILRPIRGHSHGDLHPGNLLVSKTGTEPLEYSLIDLSRYQPTGLLAWDPCYLMCTSVAMRMLEGADLDRARLRHALLDPGTDVDAIDAALPLDMRRVIAGIWRAEHDYAKLHNLLDQWRNHRLVCLVAIGLILSGRGLLEPTERQWFFWLAAHAATRLLRLAPPAPDEPWQPPAELIRRPALDRGTAPGGAENTARGGAAGSPVPHGEPLYHDAACAALRLRLLDGPPGIVLVSGPRGVGKSTLVRRVLADQALSRARVYWTPTVDGMRLDLKTLIDCIEPVSPAEDGGAGPTPKMAPAEASAARLEAALDATVDEPITIVVEHAEQLLGPDGSLLDLELDEAFESLATRVEHGVSAVLISSVIPRSPTDGTWPTAEPPVTISRLRYEDFVSMLRDRPGGSSRLRRLDDEALRVLYRALQGNPRLTNLFHAVCVLAAHRMRLRALVDELSCLEPKQVPDTLLRLVINDLERPVRRVLEGLAAFGIPVPEERVVELLEEQQPEEDTLHGLERLLDSLLVRRDDGCYWLTDADAAWVLERLRADSGDDCQSDLQLSAATHLFPLRDPDPRSAGDLAVHFAEIRAMLRARAFETAYEMIERLDDRLREWNSSYLVLEQRETVCGKLGDAYLEMANENALGGIHRARGRFNDAKAAYHRALTHAENLGSEVAQLRVSANLAAMSWLDGDPREAHRNYTRALAAAERLHDPVVRMSALEGLADCHRRWGQFREAISRATQARAVPEEPGFPDSLAARRSAARTVTVAVKLSRWHAETGQLSEAGRWLDIAEADAQYSGDHSHRAALRDAQADQLLRTGDLARALAVGADAAALAIRRHDPVILTQARTTRCLALLAMERLNDAGREIETVGRYRHPGRSLVVLALQGVVARRQRRSTLARMRFRQLLTEAAAREDDPRDFAARDFAALARCADVLNHAAPVDEVAEAFRESRAMAPAATGLRHTLVFLVNQLDRCVRPAGQLRPVIEALSEAIPDRGPS